jgi:hypothetical protein
MSITYKETVDGGSSTFIIARIYGAKFSGAPTFVAKLVA